jgi:hypothetical protein
MLATLRNIEQQHPLLVPSGSDSASRSQLSHQKKNLEKNHCVEQFHCSNEPQSNRVVEFQAVNETKSVAKLLVQPA